MMAFEQLKGHLLRKERSQSTGEELHPCFQSDSMILSASLLKTQSPSHASTGTGF